MQAAAPSRWLRAIVNIGIKGSSAAEDGFPILAYR